MSRHAKIVPEKVVGTATPEAAAVLEQFDVDPRPIAGRAPMGATDSPSPQALNPELIRAQAMDRLSRVAEKLVDIIDRYLGKKQ